MSDVDVVYMELVPYASVVDNVMYIMICTGPDITHAMSVVNRYMTNSGKAYREVVK